MLKELSIRNFAIIDDLRLRLEAGLTVLSGETGAGKTIIINALNLILGSRASTEMVRTGAESAEVEALFDLSPGSGARRAAMEMGYEVDQGLLVRRVISRSDGNRVYINGRLATLQVLGAVTENLASISGQHAHQGLLREEQHLLILDQVAGLMPQRAAVAGLYREILPRIKALKALEDRRARQAELTELLRFQQQEIAAAAIQPQEDRQLEEEKLRLKNAEALRHAVQSGIDALYGDPGAVAEKLTQVRRDLERVGRFDPRLAQPQQACADLAFRLEDLVAELQSYVDTIEVDERRLEAVEERLDALNRLKRKYGGSLEAVEAKLSETGRELDAFENLEGEIAAVEKRLGGLRDELRREATRLSKSRHEAARRFAEQVAAELAALKMGSTRFEVAFTPAPPDADTAPQLRFEAGAVSESGIDRALFTIAPNVGEALKPLAAIASGGELSRVVLALKSILADSETVATIVFDEVDAGIGGAVAEVVGRKLAELARHHQVVCITHLPQIAKFGDRHFKIAKQIAQGRTRTTIQALKAAERVKEIARMLGGEKITKLTLAHAQELLEKR
jgi:DNA repair protein RecN (Recombination protein N)